MRRAPHGARAGIGAGCLAPAAADDLCQSRANGWAHLIVANTYERAAIEAWFAGGRTDDPRTAAALDDRTRVLNHAIIKTKGMMFRMQRRPTQLLSPLV